MSSENNSDGSANATSSTFTPSSTPSTATWSSWWSATVASTVENAHILAATVNQKAQVIAEQAQPFIEQATKAAQEKAQVIAQETKILYDQSVTQVNSIATQYQQSSFSARGGSSRGSGNKALDLQYITENVISMSFPAEADRNPPIPGSNDIIKVAAHLKLNHGGHFMIWNVSEESYDYSLFDDQVLEYKFPGHPSPPLYLLFKICTSIESWLDADERNVAVIHCLTGKGRTTTLIACILAWIGEFASPAESLYYIADIRKIPVEYLTIPSQKRYIQYFSNTLENIRPRSEPLILRRILFNTIPVFGNRGENGGDDVESNYGCCPYIQLFKSGKLIATAAPIDASRGTSVSITEEDRADAVDRSNKRLQLQWIPSSEGNMSFSIDQAIQGDILMRCRHVGNNGSRISMFRLAFHTGYVPSGDVLRLTKAQLDGPTSDDRFDDEFFIDLIFSPVVAPDNNAPVVEELNSAEGNDNGDGSRVESLPKYVEVKNVFTTSAVNSVFATAPDTFEALLNESDSGFWDQVSSRKLQCRNRKPRKFNLDSPTSFSISDEVQPSTSSRNKSGIPKDLVVNAMANANRPTASTVLQASLSQRSKNASLTDEELILQSYNNHDGENLSISNVDEFGGSSSKHSSDILDDDMEEFIRNLSVEGGLSPLESTSTSRNYSKNKGGADGSILSPNTINAVVKDELDALEELERVLGLDEVKTSGRQLQPKSSPDFNKNVNKKTDIEELNSSASVKAGGEGDDSTESSWVASSPDKDSSSGSGSGSRSTDQAEKIATTSINLDDLDDFLDSESNNTSFKSGNDSTIEENFAKDFNEIEKYFESLESPPKSDSNS